MKAARFVFPIVAAIVVVGAAAGFFWWQVRWSAERVAEQTTQDTDVTGPAAAIPDSGPVDASDKALFHLRQGDLAFLRGTWATAESEYQESVRSGGGVVALRKLAQVQLQRRKLDDVRGTIERLRQAGARADDLLLLDVLVMLRSGEQQQALARLNQATDTPQKHYGLALLAISQGNHEEAQTQLSQVINGWDPVLRTYAQTLKNAYAEFAQFPESSVIHLTTLLARALAEVQECDLALPMLSHALGEQEDYRDAWIVQGYCELATERYPQARASLERAYSLDPEKPEIQFFLGKTYAALGNDRSALQFFQYALKNGLQPQKDLHELIAQEAQKLGDPTTALEQYKAMTQDDDAELADFQTFVGFALSIKQTQDAVDAATRATKKWPQDAGAFELLGTTLVATDSKDDARAAFEKALKLDPTRESAREELKKLQ